MKPVIILFLVAVLLFTFTNLNDESSAEYHIRCQMEGLILYDDVGTNLEYPETGDDQLLFLDVNGDKVAISNKATCDIERS